MNNEASSSAFTTQKPSPLQGPFPNAKRLLWAGFFSIFAAGVGFGVRGGILIDWAREYNFTQTELGEISGGGLWGFGLVVVIVSLMADKIGYGRLMIFAFAMHILTAVLQMLTGPIFDNFGRGGVYLSLTIAMVMFSIANGTCEVVVNPMVATLFPNQKTHYLNILHAGWPGGLITGGLIGFVCSDLIKVNWLLQMSLFLVPVGIYGFLLLGQHIPRSEASQAGLGFKTMLAEFLFPVLLLLLFIQALVGYVELGTDSWISKITGHIMDSRGAGMLLFIYTSGLMFALRFFAGPLEHSLSPLGLLCVSGVFGAIGLTLLGGAVGVVMCVIAATVYALGKTYLWPTMLAVVSERFPKGGALTIGAVGAVGMLSAGLIGTPAIGFQQDHYASTKLKEESFSTFERYVADTPKHFLFFETQGLDGTKVGLVGLEGAFLYNEAEIQNNNADLAKLRSAYFRKPLERLREEHEMAARDAREELDKTLKNLSDSKNKDQQKIAAWWETGLAGKNPAKDYADQDAGPIGEAGLYGGRMALRWTALVPATMAVLYLLLIIYFMLQGGYKRVVIEEDQAMEKAMETPGSAEA
jgi:MFS family permease